MNGTNQGDYIHIREAKKIIGVSSQTLYNWDKQGKIRTIRLPSGARLFHKQDIYEISGIHPDIGPKEKIVYCRVSSKKQMDDLERQKGILQSQFPDYKLVTDIASGLNWKRKGLQTLLEQAMQGHISEIVVAHKDRLCRFGFELIEFIFQRCGTKITLLDHKTSQSSEQELAEDILSIIHVYSCRQMGKRRYKNKKDKVIPQCGPEENVEGVDGNI